MAHVAAASLARAPSKRSPWYSAVAAECFEGRKRVVIGRAKLPEIPASFFGMVLGLAGLGSAWRAAHRLWQLPEIVGELLMLAAAVVWAVLTVLFALKWILTHDKALSEANHPIQCCFVGLVGVATMIIAVGAAPYSSGAALFLLLAGVTLTLVFALWRVGLLWRGARDVETTTPILYLPTVAGSFVTAIACGALGFTDWGQLAFGAGLFSWLSFESVLLHRLYTAPMLLAALRPTLGIQLAPPTVGLLAYLSITGGPPDIFAHALLGYGLLQAFLLLRLLPWIMEQPFTPSYWAFTFGGTALATASVWLVLRGDTGALALIAPVVFVAATLMIAVLSAGTLWLAVRGRLLPPPAQAAANG